MITFLKLLAAVVGFISIIPLVVWAGSGSLREAWYATKRFCLIMAFIFGGGAVLAGIFYLSSL